VIAAPKPRPGRRDILVDPATIDTEPASKHLSHAPGGVGRDRTGSAAPDVAAGDPGLYGSVRH